LYSGTSVFKKGYQPRINIVKDERSDLFTNSHSILARWRNNFPQLLNVHVVNNVRQTEIHTAGSLVPEPSTFKFEMATEKLNRYTSPGIFQIPAELIKARRRTFHSEIHNLSILFGLWRNCLRSGRSQSLCLFIRSVTVLITEAYHFCELHKTLCNILLLSLPPHAKEITGDHQCGYRHNRSITDHIFCICKILKEKKWEYNKVVYQLFIGFKKAYNSVRREVSYNILTEFSIPMKLVNLIKYASE